MTSLPTLETVLRIDFRHGGNSRPVLDHGWGEPEAALTRMLGLSSSLSLPLPDRDGAMFLQLKLAPLGVAMPASAQLLRLIVNGYDIADHEITEPVTLTDYLPPEALTGDWAPRLLLEHPTAAGDASLGLQSVRVLRIIDRPCPDQPRHHAPEAPPLRAMLLDFEALGEAPDFALFRRRHGVRPLDVFQTGGAPLGDLLTLLDDDLAALTAPDGIEAIRSAHPGGAATWLIGGSAHRFGYNTGLPAADRQGPAVAAREQARLVIAVRRLHEALATGSRILLFHQLAAAADEAIIPLLAAVQDRGPNTLLWVTPADAEHPPGSVEVLMRGFLRGYVAPMGRAAADEAQAHDIWAGWAQMCRLAWRSWRSASPDTADAEAA